jgi:hypothetical protein
MNPYAAAAAGMAGEEPANRYAAGAAELADSQRVNLRANVMAAGASSADAASSAVRLSRQAGAPLELVQRNLPAVQQRLAADRVDADTARTPVLRNRYMDPAFAAVAHDDSAALARFEQKAYSFGNAFRKGVAGAKLTVDFLADRLANSVGADRSETQRILQETATYYRAQGSDPDLAAAGERAKTAGGGTWYGTLLHLPGEIAAADSPFDVVGKFLTEQLPGSLFGFGIGAAATAPARSAIAARISSQMVAKGTSTAIAGAAGNSTAVVVQSLGTNYAEGVAQGLGEPEAAARAWKKTLAEVPANAIAGAALGLKIGGGQLANILAQTGIQGAGGGIGAAQAAHAVGEEADPVEIALEILGEGVSAGPELAGLTFSRIAESRAVQRADAAQVATESAQQVGEMIQAADASALKKRDPETFAELVEHIQPDTMLYVAPEHLAGVDLAALPDLAAKVREAEATGGDVQVQLSDLLAHLPGEQLLPHLRMDPRGMTLAEAQGFDGRAELDSELTGPPADVVPMAAVEQGMTPQDWADYLAAADESALQTIESRDARSLRDQQWLANAKTKAAKELRGLAAAARAGIEATVADEIAQQPAYAAQRFMASAEAKGMHPDVIAEQFGYTSADAMAQDIAASGIEAQAIEQLVDERMREEHPDIADAIARERSAEAMVADQARVRFLATEAAALSSALGSRSALERDAQRYAKASIARHKVREVRPAQFEAAAVRAGRDAASAFRRGNTAEAARSKRSQVLQFALQSEAEATVDEVARAVAGFKRMTKPDDGTRDGNLANTARALLAQYGLTSNPDKTADDYLASVEHYDPELHADLLTLLDGMPAPQFHRELTVADFRAVRDRVEAVWSLARSTRQMEIDGQKIEIAQAAQGLAEQLAFEPAAEAEQMVGTNARLDLRMRLAGVRAALRRVEHWVDARDKGYRSGPFRHYLWQPVSEAVTRYRGERNRHVNRFLQLLKTVEPTLKPGKIAAPELGDNTVFADRSALLHALLHTGNDSNRRKLLLGYQWGDLREDGSVDSTRWDSFLKRMHAEGRITAADWQFVQATWDLLEQMKPAAQQAHKKMFGFFFDEITAEPVQTPFGELRGGYVPAVTDSLLVPEARTHGAMDDMLSSQNSPMFPAVNRGFTKSRIETYARPLALDLRLLPAHIDKVARFAVLGPVLRDAARLVTRNKHFRASMDSVDPTAIESMLVPWLKRVATQTLTKAPETQADRAVARIATRVRNRTGLLLMAGNVVNTLQQFTGFSVAALRVKPRLLAAGMVQLVRNPTSTVRAINELSPWMQQRSDDSARDVDQTINELLTNPGPIERAEQLGAKYGYALQQGAQNVIDRIVWLGAYRQAELQGVTDVQAVRDADAAVRMTQSSFAPEDSAKVEHAGAFTRIFLQFYSYFGGQMNMLATEAQNARGKPGRLALVYLLGFAVPAFMADLITKGMRGELGGEDDDGDELADQLLQSFFHSQARYALGMAPVVGQVGNAAIGQFTPNRFDDRIGASPVYSSLEATVRAPRSILRAIDGDGSARTAVRDGLTAVGVLTGLPVGPLVRPLGYLASDEAEDADPGDMVRGLITGTAGQ